jgi:hypothetical protein
MDLNADIVFDNLPPELNARMAGPKVLELTLRRPELYEGGGAPFEANRLYLVNSERVPQRAHAERGCVVVCVGDTPLLDRYRKSCSVIVVERDASFYQVFNTLQRIFNGYDKWESELREVIDESGDVGRLLKLSEPVFGNPLFAIDEDFKILGASGGAATPLAGKGQTDGRTLGVDVFDQFLELHDLSMHEREPLVLTLLDQTTLNFNLFESDVYRGCLTVLYEGRPYRPSDKPLVELLGRYLLAAMQQLAARAPEGLGSLRQAVQALVEERPLDTVERDVVAAANDGRRFACMRLKLSNQLEQLPLGFVRNAIEEAFPGSIVFEYHRNSVVAMLDVGGTGDEGFRAAIEEGLEPFVNAMAMDAGVSNPCNDLLVAKSLFVQANHALDLGLLFDPAKRLYYFEDYALRELVMNSVQDMRLELLFPEGLRRLVDHDKNSSTSYIETLRVYLENNLSIAKTSSDLFVHRSTLMERLARMKRELGLDLDDPDVQLRLRILLKAMQSRSELRSAQERKQA